MQKQRWALVDALVDTTALATIRRDLGASLSELERTVNAYTLSFAVLMCAAALGDRYGRRRMFSAGAAIFGLASAACAHAPSAGVLIAARAAQGAGAAPIMPLALALLSGASARRDRPRRVKRSLLWANVRILFGDHNSPFISLDHEAKLAIGLAVPILVAMSDRLDNPTDITE